MQLTGPGFKIWFGKSLWNNIIQKILNTSFLPENLINIHIFNKAIVLIQIEMILYPGKKFPTILIT